MRVRAATLAALALLVVAGGTGKTGAEPRADTALIIAIDVSQSVDQVRYDLRMEGIAQALEDPGVLDAILSGPKGGRAIRRKFVVEISGRP